MYAHEYICIFTKYEYFMCFLIYRFFFHFFSSSGQVHILGSVGSMTGLVLITLVKTKSNSSKGPTQPRAFRENGLPSEKEILG